MTHMLIAAFDNVDHADLAVDELEELGYTTQDVSVISKDTHVHAKKSTADSTASGALTGATTGGVIGGVAGLLAGAGVIPALAGLLIGGPIAAAIGATGIVATTISGAITGAAAGGLLGALMGLGMPEEDARYYNDAVDHGGIILAIPSREGKEERVKEILDEHGATRVKDFDLKESVAESL